MDKPNIFKEDTDLNICKSWLVGSTDGQTYSITDRFVPRIKEDESDRDFYDKVNAHIDGEIIPVCPYLPVDDPTLEEKATKMLDEINRYIKLMNTAVNEKRAVGKGLNPCVASIMENGKVIFNVTYDNRYKATKRVLDILFDILADGDGENGGKGSLYNCADEIFHSLFNGGTYAYADLIFRIVPLDK